MGQININDSSDRGERRSAAGMNMVTALIALVVVAILAWLLLAGPLSGTFGGGTTTSPDRPVPQATAAPNVNVNPEVNINPPAQQAEPQATAAP